MTRIALFVQLEEQATVDNQAAPIKSNVCAAESEDLTQCLILKKLEAAGKARARWESPALHSTMANQDTAVIQEEESTKLTRKQTKHQML